MCLFTFNSIGQTFAPDFTLTDVNGINRNLYNELDSNKTVILDFYLTSCGTCINNIPTIENLWQTYSYSGDSLWIWGIEIGGTSDSSIIAFNQLYNVTYPTFGTLYNDSIINLYNITYAPQYCIICSNKIMKFVSVSNLPDAIDGCKQITNNANINFQAQEKWFNFNNNELHFYLSQSEFPSTLNVYNLLGNVLFTYIINSNSDIVNLNFLNSGIYLISNYSLNGKIINAKILKN